MQLRGREKQFYWALIHLYEFSGTQNSSFGRALPRHVESSKTLKGIWKWLMICGKLQKHKKGFSFGISTLSVILFPWGTWKGERILMYLLPSKEEIWQTRKQVTPDSRCTTLYIPLPTLIRGITLAEVCPTGATNSRGDKTTSFYLLIKLSMTAVQRRDTFFFCSN